MNDIAYGDGRFLAVGYTDPEPGSNVAPHVAYTSSDGHTWTEAEGSGMGPADSIAFGDGVWIGTSFIKGDYGEWSLARSTDGKTWPYDGGDNPAVYEDTAAYGGSQWLIGGQPSLVGVNRAPDNPDGALYASPDGLSWTAVGTGQFAMNPIAGLAYGNGKWVVVGKDATQPNGIHGNPSTQFFTSTDGRTWTKSGHLDTEPIARAFG
jgi:hypothetical protein